MRISFDLDDTLIPASGNEFPTEKRNLFQKMLSVELLRKGTINFFKTLQKQGHHIGIYTSSYRPLSKIRFQFWSYGLYPDFIINESISRKEINKRGLSSSKYPPAFGIDLHIDDSAGLAIEGKQHHFQTLILAQDNENWVEEVLGRMLPK